MAGYLLDTSVLVLAIRNAVAFQTIDSHLQILSGGFQPIISIITHGEILVFAKKRAWGTEKRKELEGILENLVILPVDQTSLVDYYADLESQNEKAGLNVGQNDLWIAATAIDYNLTLLTTDGDFERCPEPLKFIRYNQQTGIVLASRG